MIQELIDEMKAQIAHNQTLIAIVSVLAELTMTTTDNNSANVIHMLQSADHLKMVNNKLFERVKELSGFTTGRQM